ncbi:unnamed protein product [Didymodactylos carnosus]|uniref:MATH domain-containing protein n=1 Tax=Didymodactylos carnosus TaxID=1234261 RepID=A0A815FIG2_9BILA|nr:unnamed protein product [Didymodactylos carnosus]CAF1323953.1 unnamed protein product [Didymodactylos carnosus]CAF3972516.1 unnamed protein product [Didymodactylos carnosus]CAF4172119.1 unnamed protein product [Didymodactylos carnosus]
MKYGCGSQIIRENLSNHYLNEQHQSALVASVRDVKLNIDQFKNGHTTLSISASASSLTTVKQEPTHMMEVETVSSSALSVEMSDLHQELQKCHETLLIFDQGVQTLSSDVTRLDSEAQRHQQLIQSAFNEIQQLKLSVDEKDTFLVGIAANKEILEQELTNIQEKIQNIESVSYDGTQTWKITNVSNKTADAQSERCTSIYSPPFYSSPAGYKMRARLYLHGDGNARRTHISLFFVLMKGDYDAVLKWPFNHIVTFCLFDQSGQNRHVIDSFLTDTKSNSFQRPRSEMNIASGIPKFCAVSMIQPDNNNYVRDDTMFIKIMVDFANLSKMLPFAFNLNPGLPLHIQQLLIKQEWEKRQPTADAASAMTSSVITPTSCD